MVKFIASLLFVEEDPGFESYQNHKKFLRLITLVDASATSECRYELIIENQNFLGVAHLQQ